MKLFHMLPTTITMPKVPKTNLSNQEEALDDNVTGDASVLTVTLPPNRVDQQETQTNTTR